MARTTSPDRSGPTRRSALAAGAAGTVTVGGALAAPEADAAHPDLAMIDRGTQVLVVGGGLSGCAAAISARRAGVRVVLVEHTHLLGGQMTASGVGTADITPDWWGTVHSGLWQEFTTRLRRIYDTTHGGKPVNVARYRLTSFAANAHVVDEMLTAFLREVGVEVIRNNAPSAATVTSTGAWVRFRFGLVSASVVIDATEDGVLLDLAKLTHRIGNTMVRGGVPDRDLSTVSIQSVTLSAVLKRYPGSIPPGLRLLTPPEGYAERRDLIAANYPYRPWRKYGSFAGYRALPDVTGAHYIGTQEFQISRTALNYLNDQVVTGDFLTDPAVRQREHLAAVNQSLSIIYYLQHELGLTWAPVVDEKFADSPFGIPAHLSHLPRLVRHLPPQPYIRESRRFVGLKTMTWRSLVRSGQRPIATWSEDAVAVGTYPMDLHGGNDPSSYESIFDESEDRIPPNFRAGPYPILRSAMVPADTRRIVMAEKNLSMSRLASSSARVHPSVTSIGQAAGAIAAASVRRGIAPRDVPAPLIQAYMLRWKAMITPLNVEGIPVGHPDWPSMSMAIARRRASYTTDVAAQVLRMTRSQRTAALTYGRSAWEAYRFKL